MKCKLAILSFIKPVLITTGFNIMDNPLRNQQQYPDDLQRLEAIMRREFHHSNHLSLDDLWLMLKSITVGKLYTMSGDDRIFIHRLANTHLRYRKCKPIK